MHKAKSLMSLSDFIGADWAEIEAFVVNRSISTQACLIITRAINDGY